MKMTETDTEDLREIYKKASTKPTISFALFCGRIRRRGAGSEHVSEHIIKDALYLNATEYKKKYATRKTYVRLDGVNTDLLAYYSNLHQPIISYRSFYQRVKGLGKDDLIDEENLRQAAFLPRDEWISYFGGGRHRSFIYEGEEYPDLFGQQFHSVAAFLRTINRYDERATIWARLKAGWTLDDALIEPVVPLDDREGTIYLVTCARIEHRYVGLTRMRVEQRWRHHVRVALEKNAQSELAKAIRRFGPKTFHVEILEGGLSQTELPIREIHWIEKLNTVVPNGLNVRPGGQMGGGKGKKVIYEGEEFPSAVAFAAALSARTGIAEHVILRRCQNGKPIPKRARKSSKHPEAGTNLWRRWKALVDKIKNGTRSGDVDPAWLDYDRFASDVRPGYKSELQLVRKDKQAPWGPDNYEWVTDQVRVEQTHGATYIIDGQSYPSLNAVARAFGIGNTTLRNRMDVQGMSIEEAVSKDLGATSKFARSVRPTVSGPGTHFEP